MKLKKSQMPASCEWNANKLAVNPLSAMLTIIIFITKTNNVFWGFDCVPNQISRYIRSQINQSDYFHPLEVVDRYDETQLHVGENHWSLYSEG